MRIEGGDMPASPSSESNGKGLKLAANALVA